MLPVIDTIRWLKDHWELKWKSSIWIHTLLINISIRIINTIFVTKTIEEFLLLKLIHKFKIYIRRYCIFWKFVLVTAKKCHI